MVLNKYIDRADFLRTFPFLAEVRIGTFLVPLFGCPHTLNETHEHPF